MDERARGQQGGDWTGPHFPRYGEHWFECYICGADYPISKSFRHYKTHRLVCMHCDDQKTHSDYMQEIEAPREDTVTSEQPVSCQGLTADGYWYIGIWYDAEWYWQDECDVDPTCAITTSLNFWYTGHWYAAEWYGDETCE